MNAKVTENMTLWITPVTGNKEIIKETVSVSKVKCGFFQVLLMALIKSLCR